MLTAGEGGTTSGAGAGGGVGSVAAPKSFQPPGTAGGALLVGVPHRPPEFLSSGKAEVGSPKTDSDPRLVSKAGLAEPLSNMESVLSLPSMSGVPKVALRSSPNIDLGGPVSSNTDLGLLSSRIEATAEGALDGDAAGSSKTEGSLRGEVRRGLVGGSRCSATGVGGAGGRGLCLADWKECCLSRAGDAGATTLARLLGLSPTNDGVALRMLVRSLSSAAWERLGVGGLEGPLIDGATEPVERRLLSTKWPSIGVRGRELTEFCREVPELVNASSSG